MTTGWAGRVARLHGSIIGPQGPSRWATYKASNGASVRIKGVYESQFQKQTAQDFDAETFVVSQEPRFGVRNSDFNRRCPLSTGAILTIDDEAGCSWRVERLEDTVIGWTDLVLEKISGG